MLLARCGWAGLGEFCSNTSANISRCACCSACCSGRCRQVPPAAAAAAAAQPPPYPVPPAATSIAAALLAPPPRVAQDLVQLDAAVKAGDTLLLGEHKRVVGEEGVLDLQRRVSKIRWAGCMLHWAAAGRPATDMCASSRAWKGACVHACMQPLPLPLPTPAWLLLLLLLPTCIAVTVQGRPSARPLARPGGGAARRRAPPAVPGWRGGAGRAVAGRARRPGSDGGHEPGAAVWAGAGRGERRPAGAPVAPGALPWLRPAAMPAGLLRCSLCVY